MDFFACCSNRMLDRDGKDAFAPGGDLSPEGRKEACEKQCGLGIAFKPDKRGNLFVKRLVPGGPADASKLIEVSGAGGLAGGMRSHRACGHDDLALSPCAPACRTRALCALQPEGLRACVSARSLTRTCCRRGTCCMLWTGKM